MLAVRVRLGPLGPREDPTNGRVSPHSALPKSVLVLLRTYRLLRKNPHSYVAFTWPLLPVPGRAKRGTDLVLLRLLLELGFCPVASLPPINDQSSATTARSESPVTRGAIDNVIGLYEMH